MRWTIGKVWNKPSEWLLWWEDLPYRRKWWWQGLLFAPGEGWLKWDSDFRERIFYDPPDIDQWCVYPPLRRYHLLLKGLLMHPWCVYKGYCGWNEFVSKADLDCLISEDRKRLWR